ncbi:hypothetical protein [Mycobacteroides abscessus]|uniref:hypothetical protein n=1 Tax=Mycobacteroides abscessus TaxID=36809 RepID=UPI000925DA3C|nr:hypothetical protein [Mycobacteroides abscessus]DAZ90343.1 TPA_asm: scaffolding protein [Mycobacterium phage prophiFSQJ01-1]SII41253.1 Uncharacterised protein [Mycobacteroides abscessus subsp. abscessus]SIK13918.1 Uncharacterised protein [Mycobacteroides abscessus subsp. abscessus]SIN25548.1 Uncharacterised protein [Mycobacteroides abscessus subsp. abscessus]SLI51369.1 Uncharacterised protein [Mycobacteroides abscessus subsp. abscessus]
MSEGTGSPTPNSMPGAAESANSAEADGGSIDELETSYDEQLSTLEGERDHWKEQARKNEQRAKSNAAKAKEHDQHFADYKAAWEREQQQKENAKTPDQRVLDQAATDRARAEKAEADRAEAEAMLLRYQLAEGLPSFLLPLIKGTTEDEIRTEVDETKARLAEYVTAQQTGQPRRPSPDPALGRGGAAGATAIEQFEAAMRGAL